MSFKITPFEGLYLVLISLDIALSYFLPTWTIFVKPLLMLSLIIWFLKRPIKNRVIKIGTTLALLFSLAGDVFLIDSEQYFIAGLLSFLFAHLCYIYLFRKQASKNHRFLNRFSWALLLFGAVYFWFLFPNLKELAIPVGVYLIVIVSMALSANHRNKLPENSYRLGILGALLFVISDSLLAYNSFVTPFASATLFVMSTYALAQLFIVKSIVYSLEN